MNKRWLSIILVLFFIFSITYLFLLVFNNKSLPDYANIKIGYGGGSLSYNGWTVLVEKNLDDINIKYTQIFLSNARLRETNMSVEEFEFFWKELNKLNFKRLKDEYIVPAEHSGWGGGYMTFEYKLNNKEYFKEVKFTDGVSDKRFKSIFSLLESLEEKVPLLEDDKIIYYVKNAQNYTSLDKLSPENEEKLKYFDGVYQFKENARKGYYYSEVKEILTGDYSIESKNVCLDVISNYKTEEMFSIVENLFINFLDGDVDLYHINIYELIMFIKNYKDDSTYFISYLSNLKEYVKNEDNYTRNRLSLINLIKEILPDECSVTPVEGPCKAKIYKYYYNHINQVCDEFLWGGCDGVVPFNTLEECKSTCQLYLNDYDIENNLINVCHIKNNLSLYVDNIIEIKGTVKFFDNYFSYADKFYLEDNDCKIKIFSWAPMRVSQCPPNIQDCNPSLTMAHYIDKEIKLEGILRELDQKEYIDGNWVVVGKYYIVTDINNVIVNS